MLTHEYSIYVYFKGTKDVCIHRREEQQFSLFLHLLISLFLFSIILPMSLYMYKLNISSSVQALISWTCFIRGVNRETFFSDTLSKPTQSCSLCERKIPFVLCQHKHFNLRLPLLSKQQISSEAQRDTGNECGSFSLSLISRGIPYSTWPPCFQQSVRACVSQTE